MIFLLQFGRRFYGIFIILFILYIKDIYKKKEKAITPMHDR